MNNRENAIFRLAIIVTQNFEIVTSLIHNIILHRDEKYHDILICDMARFRPISVYIVGLERSDVTIRYVSRYTGHSHKGMDRKRKHTVEFPKVCELNSLTLSVM